MSIAVICPLLQIYQGGSKPTSGITKSPFSSQYPLVNFISRWISKDISILWISTYFRSMTIRYIYYIRIVITWSTTIVVCSIHSISVEWLHFVQLQGILNFNYFQLGCNGYSTTDQRAGYWTLIPSFGLLCKKINSDFSWTLIVRYCWHPHAFRCQIQPSTCSAVKSFGLI